MRYFYKNTIWRFKKFFFVSWFCFPFSMNCWLRLCSTYYSGLLSFLPNLWFLHCYINMLLLTYSLSAQFYFDFIISKVLSFWMGRCMLRHLRLRSVAEESCAYMYHYVSTLAYYKHTFGNIAERYIWSDTSKALNINKQIQLLLICSTFDYIYIGRVKEV